MNLKFGRSFSTKFRLLVCLLCFLLFILIWKIAFWSKPDGGFDPQHLEDLTAFDSAVVKTLSPEKLQVLITELMRIKSSVKNELVDLERKRQRVISEVNAYSNQMQQLKYELLRYSRDVTSLRINIESLKMHQDEIELRNTPLLKPPVLVLPDHESNTKMNLHSASRCSMHTCFFWHKCSVAKPLFVSLRNKKGLNSKWSSMILKSSYYNKNELSSCIIIAFTPDEVKDCLAKAGNCLLISNGSALEDNPLKRNSHFSMVASETAFSSTFRENFDIVLPSSPLRATGEVWTELSALLPARRKTLLTFVGSHALSDSLPPLERMVLKELRDLLSRKNVLINISCNDNHTQNFSHRSECDLPVKTRLKALRDSTFCLILGAASTDILSSKDLQSRLYDCLISGSVPVILGEMRLPFSEVIPQWERSVIHLAKARVTELHFILKTFSDQDIVEMRRQGRLIMETYLGTLEKQVQTLMVLLSRRLHLPLPPISSVTSKNALLEPMITYQVTNTILAELDEFLGPLEPINDSPEFTRNFSSLYHSTNAALFSSGGDPDPFHLYPSTPWAPQLPSQAQFEGSTFGFRPIDHNINNGGSEFGRFLGGNMPYEMYTIVILTYKRPAVLMSTLEIFNDLPYLHSVVVVWNGEEAPSKTLKWPKLHVPLHVVKGGMANSLNNRFIPYDVIKTEAILSLDDDVQLRPDEIVFGFRVWRENRDRVVGFPARFHHWSQAEHAWHYNSNYTCQLSMVLTGAAFIHKYYMYLYTFEMAPSIRIMVDKYTNCEDLAMNFLVSHVTRKPPLKVTSRWTFACPSCTSSLFKKKSHFNERSICINYLTKVFGYNPLIYTQYRVDSVLFKTRLPMDKQKCFKYV